MDTPNTQPYPQTPPQVASTSTDTQAPAPLVPPVTGPTDPNTGKKKVGIKKILIGFAVFFLLVGTIATILLVQRNQDIREDASSGSACDKAPDCELLNNPGNSGSYTAPKVIAYIDITNQTEFRYNPGNTNDGCYNVSIQGTQLTWSKVGSGSSCKDISNIQVWVLTSSTNTPTITQSQTASCPAGTEYLFTNTGNLPVNSSVALNGKVSSVEGSWTVGTQSNIKMAEDGRKMTVTFPSNVILDTVLIYDNDPKSGESPWKINGVSLPTTNNDTWGPAYKLNITTKEMTFDNGGDSPHFNVCVKPVSTTGTTTPTVTPTLPPGVTAQCGAVEAYDTNWNKLTSAQLSQLKSGEKVRFAVGGTASSGTFDKAKITVNGTALSETSTKKPGSEMFYSEYTIPAGTVNFTVSGQVHHSTLGWI